MQRETNFGRQRERTINEVVKIESESRNEREHNILNENRGVSEREN